MKIDVNEEFRRNLQDIKRENHFDGKYVVQLKSQILLAHKMDVGCETIMKIIDEIGFDEPIRSVLREYARL
nr:hypothetical protein [Clostridia bacterium]